ncbi:MAG: response regulator receiver modulated diguanylate cyclase [uncultured bacterium]|nr:MAG: response regulator receiver modulated diguanylate cyclase [uncultured bacterium]
MTDRRDIFLQLLQTKKLPTPSETALDVMRLCQSESVSLHDIGERIQTDPALSAELIRYANSALMSTGIQVASVQKATVKLGIKTVVNLALGFSLISHNKEGKCQSFNYSDFWSKSLSMALAAKTIAGHVKGGSPDELFICGLLAHTGELAFATLFPKEYSALIDQNPSFSQMQLLEKEAFGLDSADLTVELFLDWGLPAQFALAAGFHGTLGSDELGESTTREIATLLNLAELVAILCHSKNPSRNDLETIEDMALDFNIEKRDFKAIFEEIIALRHDWSTRYKISAISCPSYDTIKGAG